MTRITIIISSIKFTLLWNLIKGENFEQNKNKTTELEKDFQIPSNNHRIFISTKKTYFAVAVYKLHFFCPKRNFRLKTKQKKTKFCFSKKNFLLFFLILRSTGRFRTKLKVYSVCLHFSLSLSHSL